MRFGKISFVVLLLGVGIVATGLEGKKTAQNVKKHKKTNIVSPQVNSLVEAARKNNMTEVKKWVDAKTDINAKNYNGLTALYWAKRNKNQAMISYLKSKGAKDEAIGWDDPSLNKEIKIRKKSTRK